MESSTVGMWSTYVLVALPLLWCLLSWWNEFLYVLPLKFRRGGCNGLKLPPGNMGIPYFGELFTFLWYFKVLRSPDDFINSKRRKYGDGVGMYRTYLFGSPSIISIVPAINKFVLQQGEDFILEWPTIEAVGINSVGAAQGKYHARLRTYVTNAVNQPDALRRIAPLVQPVMVAGLRSWAEKGKIRALTETKKITFENIGSLFASFHPGPLLYSMDKLFAGLVDGFRASPINLPGTAYRHSLQCRKKIVAIFRMVLEQRKKENGDSNNRKYDLMDGLMKMEDSEGNKLSDQEVLDNIISLIVAGYETTALTSMWALYYLAKYPDVLQKLREENMIVNQDKKGEFITSEDVSKLKYTNKVVEETLRMANIAAFVFRTATKDVEYKGYTIPKGWKVFLWLRYVHTNPDNYDDPMCFNPDRWNKPPSPGTFQVFGGGARVCAANMLARLQLTIVLHHLAVGYKWELLNPDAEIVYLSHPRPVDGVEITFSKL